MRRVGGSGDLNADVTARDPQGRSVVVQCKRYAVGNRIGSPAIQTFIGMAHVHHKAERGIFVTTSSYTDDARALARQHGLTLWDGSDLTRMVSRTGRGRPSPLSVTSEEFVWSVGVAEACDPDALPALSSPRGRNISCVSFIVSPRQTMRAENCGSEVIVAGENGIVLDTRPGHHGVPARRHRI